MKRIFFSSVIIMSFGIFLTTGCSKKVLKVNEPVVSKEQPKETIQNLSDSTAAFIAIDMDSIAKSILVPIYFDYDQDALLPKENAKFKAIGPFLMKNRNIRVLAEGNCDERGSSEYNMGLGEKRARAAKIWLTSYGVAQSQIEITSFGKERPKENGCSTVECHSENRRVDWKVIAK